VKAGHVATIRVTPRDCQSVLDVLDAAGVPRKSLSFAQCVSLALGSLLETARRGKMIPEPDEFEYLNRMQEYMTPARRRKTVRVADALHNLGGSMRTPALPADEVLPSAAQAVTEGRSEEDEDSPEVREAQAALTKLLIKKEQAEDGGPWTGEDEAEFNRLYAIIYPNG
jgi:hypothetical protein